MTSMRMAQYGTKHAHAAGKLKAMQQNPNVELMGVFEPDAERRKALERSDEPYQGVHWFENKDDMLGDATIVAIASEGRNDESLDQTEEIVKAGKHVWLDKPAGDNWAQWQRIVGLAEANSLHIQMGYMFRYHDGFQRIAEWVKSGFLGDVFAVRVHMSTHIPEASRRVISRHAGGIFFELGCHVLGQIVWLLGRPRRVTSFLRNDSGVVPEFQDNTLSVFEYENAMAFVDIAAMEVRASATRRIEVYGNQGSAIMQPMEPAERIRLCLAEAQAGYSQGEQFVSVKQQSRQQLYDLELEAFLATILGEQPPDRPLSHELLVQETLLRATGELPG